MTSAPAPVGRPTGTPASRPPRIHHLYVHAPFCARRCVYCDFAITLDRAPRLGPWIAALSGELTALRAEGRFPLADRLDSLYVGGGTPSLLGPEAMAGLKELLGDTRLSDPGLEWTAEANPESFTRPLAEAWRSAGVTRLSLGVQSFHDGTLRWMGRLHGPEGAREATRLARSVGFETFSLDLIFGVPGRLGRSWLADLDAALDLEPPHVSLYGLTVEPATPLGRAVAEGRERPVDDDRYREEYLMASDRLVHAGYEHYEVSSFARPGHRSRHNTSYWDGVPYLGLGNGAHSYSHPLRRWNLRDWPDYQRVAVECGLPVQDDETLSEEEHRLERIWLGLRARPGLDTRGLPPAAAQVLDSWVRDGLAEAGPARVRLTAAGWVVLDRLALALDAAWRGDANGGATLDRSRSCTGPSRDVDC